IRLAYVELHAPQRHLLAPPAAGLTPRQALARQILLAAAAIERSDPAAETILGGVLRTARHQGFVNTVAAAAPQVTSYLIDHAATMRQDPFAAQLTAAPQQVRPAQPAALPQPPPLPPPLTPT